MRPLFITAADTDFTANSVIASDLGKTLLDHALRVDGIPSTDADAVHPVAPRLGGPPGRAAVQSRAVMLAQYQLTSIAALEQKLTSSHSVCA
jgi:hypothetical protein